MTINDNYKNEQEFLLDKAKDIVSESSNCASICAPCSLMAGGPCPLLNGTMMALRVALKA